MSSRAFLWGRIGTQARTQERQGFRTREDAGVVATEEQDTCFRHGRAVLGSIFGNLPADDLG